MLIFATAFKLCHFYKTIRNVQFLKKILFNKKLSTTSVILADADYLVRVGLNHILENESNIVVLGAVSDEEGLFDLMEVEPAKVVIVDYNQPNNFTIDSVLKLRKDYPETGILVVSADNEKASIYSVLEAGVTSFLTKSAHPPSRPRCLPTRPYKKPYAKLHNTLNSFFSFTISIFSILRKILPL